MPLQKAKSFPDGREGDYWVASPSSNKRSEKTEVIMLLYKDAAHRTAAKADPSIPPLHRERFSPDLAGTYKAGGDVYAHVKESRLDADDEETNWFADAVDVDV